MDFDAEGFLKDWTLWHEYRATDIANQNNITLNDSHWEIINLARDFFKAFDHAPSQRPLARYIKVKLGSNKSSSIYLMQLFGQSPAKMIARIAGLPKPKNCL